MEANVGAGSLTVGVGSGGSIAVGVALASNTVDRARRGPRSTAGRRSALAPSPSPPRSSSPSTALAIAVGVSVQGGAGVAVALTGTGAESANVVRSAVIATIAGAGTSVDAARR